MREIAAAMIEVLEGGGRAALATVIKSAGSTPQQPGARLLLHEDGRLVGTVGGGAIEHAVVEALRACLKTGKARLGRWDLGRDLGMCCGGSMELFIEPIEGRPRLLLFGAGHVAKPTAEMARAVGFSPVVIDDREELNTEARFPGFPRVLAEPKEALAELDPSERDWAIIVTHDHRLDQEALEACAARPHRYIGMIGSLRKVFRVLQRIHARRGGLPPMERVYAPIGLDIGAVSPEEIAVSIVAELVALRRGKAASHLRAIDHPRLRAVLEGALTPEAAAAGSADR